MRHTITLSLLLTLFWLLNSGHYTPLLLLLGAISIVLVIFISHRMENMVDHKAQPLHLTLRLPGYCLWLLKEIVLANIDVVYRIWRGNSTISPIQFVLKTSQTTDIGKVIYANSITLTPGTVTINLEGDAITVHGLTRKTATELQSGLMDRRVSQLES